MKFNRTKFWLSIIGQVFALLLLGAPQVAAQQKTNVVNGGGS
jgi:hypothetical protein